MRDLREQLQEYVEASIERVDADDVQAAVTQPSAPSMPSRSWLKPAWAFVLGAACVLAIGGFTMLLRDDASSLDEVAGQDDPVVAESWDPILSTVEAGTAPPAATCREDATPNKAGPVDQARPLGAQWSNQAAAFDAAMGRVVFLDGSGETWTFDVCTNTWQLMNPEYRIESGLVSPDDPDGWLGQLVYDVDSDRTIAFRGNSVAVYDSQTNTWTLRVQPSEYDTGIPGSGAIYHPGSGLVVVQTGESGLVAYDVDTNTWTPIGQVEWTEQVPPYLVGYQPETEQLVFLGGFDERGMLVDAQSGEVNESAPLEGGVFAGFGRFDFATGGDSAHVVRPLDGNGGDVCRLDPTNLAWECISMTNGPTGFGQGPGLLSASVYDPINSRIVLLYGYADGFNGQRFHEVNDIWAVDISAGQWAQLLERSGEMTYEEETPES